MNINLEIVTRALQKAGQEPLSDDDIAKNSSRYRSIRAFYLATLLETLAKTSWTSQKRRKQLVTYTKNKSGYDRSYSLPTDIETITSLNEGEAYTVINNILYTNATKAELKYTDIFGKTKNETLLEVSENFTEYDFHYVLPDDCAKPEMLINNEEFIIEGKYLYTNAENAVLMYISNATITKKVEIEENGDLYLVLDENGNLYWEDEGGDTPYDIENDKLYYTTQPDKEYEYYGELNFDAMLEEFLETRLAAKIALKITGDKQTYQTLYNESLLIEQQAEEGTLTHSKSRKNGNEWWTDRIFGGADAHY